MSVDTSLDLLPEAQRTAFDDCLKKIKLGKKIKNVDIEDIVNDESCSGKRICKIFCITKMTLHNWCNDGCPRNNDTSYSIPDIYKWRIKRLEEKAEKPIGLKEEKLKKEIEFLQARIEEKKDLYIERSMHEMILTSRAGSLRTFFEKTGLSNAVYFVGLSVDEARTKLFELFKSAMDCYCGKMEE